MINSKLLTTSVLLSFLVGAAAFESARPGDTSFVHTKPASNTSKRSSMPSLGQISKVRVLSGASPTIGRNGFPLFGKKKSKDTTAGKSGKIQVKLLKHVAGTGSAGEVIMVAPSFFANKLQKSGSAVRITDEDAQKESEEKAQKEKEEKAVANDLKEKIDQLTLSLAKKSGPDGQLFGGINYKAILTSLKQDFPQGCLDAKYIKITGIKDSDGKMMKHDIKAVGDYTATISLLKGVSADFKVVVEGEEI